MKFIKNNALNIHRIINSFADTLVRLFLPVIIYIQTSDVKMSILYIVIYFASAGILNLILSKFINKHGVLSIFLHIIPIIAVQFIVAFYPISIGLIFAIATLTSLYSALYSVPINNYFAVSDKKTNVAAFQTSAIIGRIIFILVGTYLLGSGLKNSLLFISIIATVLYVISILPLLTNAKKLKEEFNHQRIQPNIKIRNIDWKYGLFHSFFGTFSSIINEVLPLYLFVFNLSIENIGIIVCITEICKIGANYLSKYLIKIKLRNLSIVICLFFFIAGVIAIPFITKTVLLFIISAIIGVSFPFIFVPMFSDYVKKIKQENNIFNGMIEREFFVLTPRSLCLSVFFIFPSFPILFFIGAGCCVGMFTTSIKKNESGIIEEKGDLK